jgi:hypothetical protein
LGNQLRNMMVTEEDNLYLIDPGWTVWMRSHIPRIYIPQHRLASGDAGHKLIIYQFCVSPLSLRFTLIPSFPSTTHIRLEHILRCSILSWAAAIRRTSLRLLDCGADGIPNAEMSPAKCDLFHNETISRRNLATSRT